MCPTAGCVLFNVKLVGSSMNSNKKRCVRVSLRDDRTQKRSVYNLSSDSRLYIIKLQLVVLAQQTLLLAPTLLERT